MTLCFGMNNDTHRAKSCHPWIITNWDGFSLESAVRSSTELVGEVAEALHMIQECLPHSNRF